MSDTWTHEWTEHDIRAFTRSLIGFFPQYVEAEATKQERADGLLTLIRPVVDSLMQIWANEDDQWDGLLALEREFHQRRMALPHAGQSETD